MAKRQPLNGPAVEGDKRWEQRAGRSLIQVWRDNVNRTGHHTQVHHSVYLDGKRLDPARYLTNPDKYDDRNENHALSFATMILRALKGNR